MRGHIFLTRARLDGWEVETVFVDDPGVPAEKRGLMDPERSLDLGHFGSIAIEPADTIGALDLRCVRGLIVHISSTTGDRAKAIARRIKDFEPAQIIACALDNTFFRWTPKA